MKLVKIRDTYYNPNQFASVKFGHGNRDVEIRIVIVADEFTEVLHGEEAQNFFNTMRELEIIS